MPCTQCAADNSPDALACHQCGAALVPPATPILLAESRMQPAGPPLFADSNLDADRHLEGIGGWLILIALGLITSPVVNGGTLMSIHIPMLTNPSYQPFFEKNPAIHTLILFEAGSNLCAIALTLAMNYLFFTKKKSFPTYMVLLMVFNFLITLGDTVAAAILMPDQFRGYTSILRATLSAVIWIPYLVFSRRVKVTFVN